MFMHNPEFIRKFLTTGKEWEKERSQRNGRDAARLRSIVMRWS